LGGKWWLLIGERESEGDQSIKHGGGMVLKGGEERLREKVREI
jgi:hypothetical protein